MISKQLLRQYCLAQRKAFPKTQQEAAALRICASIQTLPIYQNAQHLALYRAHQGEVDVDSLWHTACQVGKTCYFPVLHEKTLLFLPAGIADPFKQNRWGVLEPQGTFTKRDDISLFIVPVIAFNSKGYRIGYGQGYYDRCLPHFKDAYCIGVAYAFQEVLNFPIDTTDYPMDLMVTEKGLFMVP